jgi:cystathionine beta-lyase
VCSSQTGKPNRTVCAPLELPDDGYRMDLDDLGRKASDPATRASILCNPHKPVGRVWTVEELEGIATICARHEVFVIADEIHADLTLPRATFMPFAEAANGTGVSWAALHGPIKTFGLAGVRHLGSHRR